VSKKPIREARWVLYLSLLLSCSAVVIAVWGLARNGQWHMPSTGAFKDFTGGIQSLITAAGVVAGGSWAYFKFIRGRTYRPRLAVELAGQWRRCSETDALHVRVRVTNIGASKVALNQYGTGLQVSFPTGCEYQQFKWEKVRLGSGGQARDDPERTFEVLLEHEWIEPGETVSDDLLLDLGRPPSIYQLELRLLWALSGDRSGTYNPDDVEVFARRIIAPEESLMDKQVESRKRKTCGRGNYVSQAV
jgi:hypothetical protein